MRDDIDGPSFLLQSARALGTSLDPPVIAARAAVLAVPLLSDRCMVDLADDRGELVRAAEAHADASRRVVVQQPSAEPTESERLEQPSATASPGTAQFVVPLNGHGRCVGAMTFAFTDAERVHKPGQRVLARQLARLVEHAVANAWMHRTELRRKDDLLTSVAHDLRTPLATLVFAVGAMQDGAPPERLLQILRHSGAYMSRLVEDLLEMHRIDGAGLTVALEPRRPADLVREAIELVWGSRSRASDPVVTIEVAPDLPLLGVDAHRMVRVLANILENAARSRTEGLRILARAERRPTEVVMSVSDNGRGISAVDLPHVFDRFWRGANGSAGGSGLGLSIAREIVRAHGGRLWAESTMGVGTTFFIALSDIEAQERPSPAVAAPRSAVAR